MQNKTGVQNSGSLSFGFDPSYQDLVLHRVRIHRNGQTLERLDASKIRVIQPEPAMDGHILTGRQRALVFVEDLRIGDVLEYAYTVQGQNPVLRGHFSARNFIQSSTPVDRQRFRVIWPPDKRLHLRQHLTDAQPKKEPYDGAQAYTWDYEELEEIPYEDGMPGSHEPYPYIEISDFDSWSQVVEWALPLYGLTASNQTSEIRELVSTWDDGKSSAEEKSRRALEFVQDELRYTGIEIGADSYRPAVPEETLRLRYGDCKAKSLLLCSLLREMGIEAFPALVNATEREAVAKRLPSPLVFNHAIVKLIIDGKPVWVDPTRSHQGGTLWERSLPRYGMALVLREGMNALESIPRCGARNLRRVESTFRVNDLKSPAILTVSSKFHGPAADSMRGYLSGSDPKQTAKDFLNFYARYYPGVEERRAMEVKDQRVLNILETTEYYRIREVWKLDRESGRWEASFYAETLQNVLNEPSVRLRKTPIDLEYPMRREHDVVVYLPRIGWEIDPHHQSVNCDAFDFGCSRDFSDSVMRSQYYCESKLPAVPADKVTTYLAKVQEMEDLLGDVLYRPDKQVSSILARINWLMLMLAGFGTFVGLAGSAWVWFATRTAGLPAAGAADTVPFQERSLRGLGGWLVFVGLGLVLAPIRLIGGLISEWEGFFSASTWRAVTVPGGEYYHPLFGPLLAFEVFGNSLLIAFSLLTLALFFSRRRVFPKVFICYIIAMAVFMAFDEGISRLIPLVGQRSEGVSSSALLRSILGALVWTTYMIRSRRVKLTFTR
jgi:transglutaminase-like putative cysteine protease